MLLLVCVCVDCRVTMCAIPLLSLKTGVALFLGKR